MDLILWKFVESHRFFLPEFFHSFP